MPAPVLVPESRPAPLLMPPVPSPAERLAIASHPAPASRWSVSAWLLVRDERGSGALAPGGTLGGSQAGVRVLYRVGERLALSGRLHAPLRDPRGAEVAVGLEWRPTPRLPLSLLAERRQDLGGRGRSAFAFSAYGGLDRTLAGLRVDAYGQAGIVGLDARDLFADGAVRVAAPLGPIEVGGGAWGGAQPGAARLDVGPTVSWRLPMRGADLRLQADWRLRVAGEAAPGSGPALTLAAGF